MWPQSNSKSAHSKKWLELAEEPHWRFEPECFVPADCSEHPEKSVECSEKLECSEKPVERSECSERSEKPVERFECSGCFERSECSEDSVGFECSASSVHQ